MLRIDERNFPLSNRWDDFDDPLIEEADSDSEWKCIYPAISTFDQLLMLAGRQVEQPTRAKRIVGGIEALRGEWPFLVSMRLRLNGTYEHLCGGVLIGKHYVLSAAHCFEKFWKAELTDDPSYWQVRVGEHNMFEENEKDSEEDIPVRAITRYPGRKFGEFQNDIAFIKLKRPAKLSNNVRHICLPDPKNDLWNEKTRCLTAGWGHKQSNATSISIVPHHVNVPIFDKKNCVRSYQELFDEVNREFGMALRISEEMICAGHEKGGKDACQYDSGGPLICKGSHGWTLAGLVSFGFDCAQPNMPGIYTDVRNFIPWIHGLMRRDACQRCRATTFDKRSCRSFCRRIDYSTSAADY